MERRYEARLEEMLEDAEVSPEMLRDLLSRLETFVEPFAATLGGPEQRRHAAGYMTGLLSNPKHKTGEAIAYLLLCVGPGGNFPAISRGRVTGYASP